MQKSPASPAPSSSACPRVSRRAWLAILAAFGLGLLLFLMLWLDQRNDHQFFRSDAPRDAVGGQVFEPLPAPLPADGGHDTASGMRPQDAQAARAPRIEERLPPPPAAPPAPVAQPAPAPPPLGPGDAPVAVSSPAPRYPPEALRRGESGTVIVRVQVAADGSVHAVEITRSSRSRALDRAALEAVRQWRFRPAQRDGQAIQGTVQVPIDFKAD